MLAAVDDNYRLIKLISLVGWSNYEANQCGLRYASEVQKARLSEAEQTAGHMMCAYYAGAVRHHQGEEDFSTEKDRQDLPSFTLRFLTGLPEDAVTVLGEMVAHSLMLHDLRDPAVVGRKWIADVVDTCWRLCLDARTERFGWE
ncbi:hypothetical protein M8C13_05115 [Crossiella sp. SN42]|uniref:hypothetical protein n=1 Tax=Crossiella sp. SN42 TaxID=2944808 RepID=UPI00207C5F9B|nr:hypothetical protein [Crossiella sp. SN42]MCO1575138.1 hypothetical protein [Crossiella sp. SN42]